LRAVLQGDERSPTVVKGVAITDLPGILPSNCWMPYETSRGCWYGEKLHCSFCGLNGPQLAHHYKASEKVEIDLLSLTSRFPTKNICMTDNIMPREYHNSLMPRLSQWKVKPSIFYETQSNLTIHQLIVLRSAGIATIQVGIKTLSTRLLKLLRKGATAAHNLLLLRNATACGINVIWNLLYDIPGEMTTDYQVILQLLPAIRHFPPPICCARISIDRYIPYFYASNDFCISTIRPSGRYENAFPEGADLAELAYHFEGEYAS
jgi:ribosomal peptide maturation radical SAM protein 1